MLLARCLPLLVLTACGASTGSQLFTESQTADASPPPSATPDATCTLEATSTLPGVHIRFAPQGCTFMLTQARAGITIAYDVVVDADLPGVVPGGEPWQPDPGPSGLRTLEVLSGSGQSYCLCDEGLGAAIPTTPITLKAGSYHATFGWDGRNWQGPSDTSNAEGPPFPVGSYRFDVTSTGMFTDASGTRSFKVAGAFRVTLIP